MIYLDHAATTPPLPEVMEGMQRAKELWCNPNSMYWDAARVRNEISLVSQALKNKINGGKGTILWTGSGSEANRLAVETVCKGPGDLLTSYIEHKSIESLRQHYGNAIPFKTKDTYPNALGFDWDKFPSHVGNHTKLISLQLVNNETGNCNFYDKNQWIRAHQRNALLHADGVQALGKIKIDVEELGLDLLTLSAHKVGGPKGLGCLWVRNDLNIKFPYLGTPNVPGIFGFAEAIKKIEDDSPATNIKDNLFYQSLKDLGVDFKLNRFPGPRTYGILSLRFPGINGIELALTLEQKGVFISTGAACNRGKPSHVLHSLGLSEKEVEETVRVSFGPACKLQQVREAADLFLEAIQELGK